MSKKNILITSGDPAGIGPIVTLKALENLLPLKKVVINLIGTRKILQKIAPFNKVSKYINLIDINLKAKIIPGKINAQSGKYAFLYLEKAIEILKSNKNYSLVTAPISKEAVKFWDKKFLGHTEYLAKKFNCKNFAMLMWGKKIKTLLLTRHIPVKVISKNLNKKNISETIILTANSLKEIFRIKYPKLAICSLNPHAGINTYLLTDEKKLLSAKTIAEKKLNLRIDGPLPSEGLFRDCYNKKYDLIFSVYHDQGMIPFKLIEFSQGTNITIGLPFLRTSPAHGTAQEIVRKPKLISATSMKQAIITAIKYSK